MSKSRDEFLEWYSALSAKDLDEVCAVTAYEIWNSAWQASRRALVVELPKAEFLTQGTTDKSVWAYSVRDTEKALDTAGVAYK